MRQGRRAAPSAPSRPDRPAAPRRLALFSPCPRGLETVLAQELNGLGAERVEPTDGGVAFRGDLALCYRANLHSRIASRVLVQVLAGRYRNEADIYQAVHGVAWRGHFDASCTIRVNVSAIASPLRSLEFITLRIKDAICDRFRADVGARPSVDTAAPDVRVHAFLEADRFTVYLDTSGEALFKRGYRHTAGEAPVRENLAAGLLLLSGWTPGTPLLDPMCGSGTLLIEAAEMSLGRAAGARRSFGFEKLRGFDRALWRAQLEQARQAARPATALPIWGSDVSIPALEHARQNLAHAGLSEAVALKQVNVLDCVAPAERGVLVTNAPYGRRIGEDKALAALYPKLGDALKQRFAGWRACIFTADLRLPKLIGLKPARRTPLYNGAVECRLYVFDIVAGTMRRPPSAGG
jgi:putative N6-adenine-specific DNA methylase